ncbi:D-alanyl-D-alanine carboxypeptidase VanXY [Gottschalkia acidurici 9a]|uniref:D-alanyl-D-alanine carboxypeptidase VanXY n=1 Tax=Gottschalkia acidurici (strain ATCC 7906 / DSM 604 / BCRC 14475 / CIP 104303 / KCTC 5404 / NCIMB 10678 / 9a) TaxID=1128398 RepID=K0AXS1_GOTA9|nr:D-alanyl-D-alanine carboxypeptidase family protein [Gottschalkia acidurici]AFS77582.1 D-alanyl-D-alanine carboxypeptidase VanXY [Gottschalkia acidurici 9a]
MKKVLLTREEIFTGNLILVNEKYPIHSNYPENLLSKIGNILLNSRVTTVFKNILEESEDFRKIIPVSGYRSRLEQENLYQNSIKENGLEFTKKYVALPNHSEHQTGLCVDLAIDKPNIDFIRPEFPYNEVCNLFRKKSIQFGFIERYPLGKEDITKIAHEPWHFRYVGFPHSMIMEQHKFCLEEYIEWIKQYEHDKNPLEIAYQEELIEISYLQVKTQEDISLNIRNTNNCLISGNNVDGFIITIWRDH